MKHILLVEPAKDMGGLVHKFLSENGHSVTWKRTAQSAVKAADSRPPDLVVLELGLPEHNGIEFLHEFRSYEDWLDIPIIIYSHIEPGKSAGEQALGSLGIVEYLYKPTSPLKILLGSVRTALK